MKNVKLTSPSLFKKRTNYLRILVTCALMPVLLFSESIWQKCSLTHKVMELLGYLFIALGVFVRVYASLYVGGHKNSSLIITGPFSVVRNPLYVGSLIATLGLGFMTKSIILMIVISGIFLVFHWFTILREESFLNEKFGEAYADYQKHVPRWIPDPALWTSPSQIMIKPEFIFRTMRDGLVFFLAPSILELFYRLRISGILPKYLTLV